MIILYQFSPHFGLPNASPFCYKLETYMRLTKIPFKIKSANDPRKGPKKKIPFIKDTERNYLIVSDSGLVMDHLRKYFGDPLDDKLTAEQKALSVSIQRMLEEHLYWVAVYSRWSDETNWLTIQRTFLAGMKGWQKRIIGGLIRKNMRNEIYQQGMGRHTATDIYKLGIQDLEALKILLGDKKFIHGDNITSIDCCVHAFLENLIYVPIKSPINDYAKQQQSFIDYCERIDQMVYQTKREIS